METSSPHSGVTLLELVVVLTFFALLVASTLALAVPLIAREGLRDATHELQSTIQLVRMEAVSRNRVCRFVIRTDARTLEAWDGMGTLDRTDDELLYRTALRSVVRFVRPDAGPAVTFTDLGDSSFEAVFDSDGTVASGQGEIVLFGGERYNRVRLFVAGGTQLHSWSGSQWRS